MSCPQLYSCFEFNMSEGLCFQRAFVATFLKTAKKYRLCCGLIIYNMGDLMGVQTDTAI